LLEQDKVYLGQGVSPEDEAFYTKNIHEEIKLTKEHFEKIPPLSVLMQIIDQDRSSFLEQCNNQNPEKEILCKEFDALFVKHIYLIGMDYLQKLSTYRTIIEKQCPENLEQINHYITLQTNLLTEFDKNTKKDMPN